MINRFTAKSNLDDKIGLTEQGAAELIRLYRVRTMLGVTLNQARQLKVEQPNLILTTMAKYGPMEVEVNFPIGQIVSICEQNMKDADMAISMLGGVA